MPDRQRDRASLRPPTARAPPRARRDRRVFVAVVLLLLFAGRLDARRAASRWTRASAAHVVLAVGEPAGWIADQLPLADAADDADRLRCRPTTTSAGGGFNAAPVGGGPAAGAAARRRAPVTPDAFDPAELGAPSPQAPPLKTLLVTGDSLAQPLDVELARAPRRRRRRRRSATRTSAPGISKTALVDWGLLSTQAGRERQARRRRHLHRRQRGLPVPGPGRRRRRVLRRRLGGRRTPTACAQMMDTYRRDGAARVYWLTLPLPRDPERAEDRARRQRRDRGRRRSRSARRSACST